LFRSIFTDSIASAAHLELVGAPIPQIVHNEGDPLGFGIKMVNFNSGDGGRVKFAVGNYIGSAPVIGTTATLVTRAIPPGTYTVTATYYDKFGNGGTDQDYTRTPFTILPSPTRVPGTITGINLPSDMNSTTPVTITVSLNLVEEDRGKVNFYDNYNSEIYLGSANVVDKKAVLSLSSFSAAPHIIYVDYRNDDGNFIDSRSTAEFRIYNPGAITDLFASPSGGAQP
jgi:hypothetical protein